MNSQYPFPIRKFVILNFHAWKLFLSSFSVTICERESDAITEHCKILCHCKKHSFSLTRANLQNWRKCYLTMQSLPSDDFASTRNKDDFVTPNISAHKHTMQFMRQLFTDLQNSGRTAKTGPFSNCVRRTPASKTGPEMASDQKISMTKGIALFP